MKILLAVDDSECSEAAVQAIASRVRPEDAEVRVLHAVEWLKEMPPSFRLSTGPGSAQSIMESRERSFAKARQLVDDVAEKLQAAGFTTSTATPDEDPRRAIVAAATEWPADLIVLGSHGRRGIDRFLLGSVADAVVRHARCSVTIVRHPDPGTSRPES